MRAVRIETGSDGEPHDPLVALVERSLVKRVDHVGLAYDGLRRFIDLGVVVVVRKEVQGRHRARPEDAAWWEVQKLVAEVPGTQKFLILTDFESTSR